MPVDQRCARWQRASYLPTYTTILNPVDGSIASQQAMLHAIALAKLMGTRVLAVHVLDEAPLRRAEVNISQAMTEMPWGREILRPWKGERNLRGYGWKRAFCRAGRAKA